MSKALQQCDKYDELQILQANLENTRKTGLLFELPDLKSTVVPSYNTNE